VSLGAWLAHRDPVVLCEMGPLRRSVVMPEPTARPKPRKAPAVRAPAPSTDEDLPQPTSKPAPWEPRRTA
jgi:hypothetical protein